MTETAAAVADGMRIHGFTTQRFLREVTVPTIECVLSETGRERSSFELSYPVMYAAGYDDRQLQDSILATRKQIAFYASTPAYRAVLDLHGWGDLYLELNELSKRGEWERMGSAVSDEVLQTFAVVGSIDYVAREIMTRYGDLVDRISLHQPYGSPADVDLVSPLLDLLRTNSSGDV
jgi:probable F420-dependent oxidoreductase